MKSHGRRSPSDPGNCFLPEDVVLVTDSLSDLTRGCKMLRKCPPQSELDRADVTIEFLRARLVSERSMCKAAKNRALELEEKVCQLEHKLEGEIARRKKAELATREFLLALQYPGTSPHRTPAAIRKDQPRIFPDGDEDDGCNCKLATILSLPRSSNKALSASSSPLQDCHNRSSFSISNYSAGDKSSLRSSPLEVVSLRHGISSSSAEVLKRSLVENPWQVQANEIFQRRSSSSSMEMVQCRSTQNQQQLHGSHRRYYSAEVVNAKPKQGFEQQAWLDSETKLTPSRRIGKSCRTFKKRDDITR